MSRAFRLALGVGVVALAAAALLVARSGRETSRASSASPTGRSSTAAQSAAETPLEPGTLERAVANRPAAQAAASAPALDAAPDAPSALTDAAPPDRRSVPVVYGALLDESGAPASVSQGWVRFDRDGRTVFGRIRESSYTATGLDPGAWHLSCVATGWIPLEHELVVPAGVPLRHDLVLAPSLTIALRAHTPDGRPLVQALREERLDAQLGFLVFREPPHDLEPSSPRIESARGFWTKLDEPGRYDNRLHEHGERPPDAVGRIEVLAPLPVHVALMQGHVVRASQLVSEPTGELTFVVDVAAFAAALADLTLRAVDAETGVPIEGVQAQLWSSTDRGGGSGTTDERGELRLQRVPPGRWKLWMRAPEHADEHVEIDLAPGERRDLGELRLERAVSIWGRVVDTAGEPASADLVWGRLDRATGLVDAERQELTQTDAEGRFRIERLKRAEYVVRTVGDDELRFPGAPERVHVSGAIVVDARAGSVDDVLLEVAPFARIVVRTALDEEEREHVRLHLRDAAGIVVRNRALGSDGAKELRVPPGAYELELVDGDGTVLARHPLRATAEEPAIVDAQR